MRNVLLPAALAGLMVAAPMAMAGTTTDGTIKAIDHTAMTITLDSGTVYKLPPGFQDPGLKVGEKVAVVWDMVNSAHQAEKVTLLK